VGCRKRPLPFVLPNIQNMEWFKFYHNKWLTDRAINNLRPQDRLCFITLLCVTSQSDERNGIVTNYCEHEIIKLTQLDINVTDDEKSDYHLAIGFTQRLVDCGVIEIVNDKEIRIKNFAKRQDTMLSPAERAKKYREKKKVTSVTKKSDESNAREDKIRKEKNRVDKIKTTTVVDDGFNSFWNNYPRKIGKSAAGKAWQKLKPPLDVVLEAIEKQKNSDQWSKDNGKFIPHPTTWLNGKRWEDEVDVVTNSKFSKYDS